MAFTLPIFNVTAYVWRAPALPPVAPTFEYDAQLYFPSRGLFDVQPGFPDLWEPPVYLRLPMGSDIQRTDIVECGASSGWFYRVRFVERTHYGFSNEYLSCVLEQVTTPGPPPPPGGDRLLMEDGFVVLLETGDRVLLDP